MPEIWHVFETNKLFEFLVLAKLCACCLSRSHLDVYETYLVSKKQEQSTSAGAGADTSAPAPTPMCKQSPVSSLHHSVLANIHVSPFSCLQKGPE